MKPMKRKALIAKMQGAGFTFLREGGDHTIYTCPCGKHRASVPRHKEISPYTMASIDKTDCMEGWLR